MTFTCSPPNFAQLPKAEQAKYVHANVVFEFGDVFPVFAAKRPVGRPKKDIPTKREIAQHEKILRS